MAIPCNHSRVTDDDKKTATWLAYLDVIAPFMSDNAIALKSGVQQTMVSKWRRGQSAPGLSAVTRICEAFGRNPVEGYVAAELIDIDLVVGSLRQNSLNLLAEIGVVPSQKVH